MLSSRPPSRSDIMPSIFAPHLLGRGGHGIPPPWLIKPPEFNAAGVQKTLSRITQPYSGHSYSVSVRHFPASLKRKLFNHTSPININSNELLRTFNKYVHPHVAGNIRDRVQTLIRIRQHFRRLPGEHPPPPKITKLVGKAIRKRVRLQPRAHVAPVAHRRMPILGGPPPIQPRRRRPPPLLAEPN